MIRKCIRGLAVLFLVVLASCSSLPKDDRAIIQTTDSPMLWEITSPTGTVVQVLGTIHVGNPGDQLILLKDSINSTLDGSAIQELQDMYNAYVTNDHEALSSLTTNSFEGMEELSGGYKDNYLHQLLYQRNQAWAQTIATLLQEENKHYFVFAGASHWICGPSIFDYLVEDGVANWL